jgi:ABC-type nitrate/sulfonate/bicarbonate transport system substrate-binding protein
MGDALKQKQVDAIYAVDPFQRNVLEDTKLTRLANPNEIQPDVITAVYVVTGKFITQDRGVTLAKFLRGLQRGNNWYNANLQSSELTDLISRYSRTDPAVVEKLPKGPAYIELNVDSVRKTAVLMKEHNLLNADIDVLDALYQKQ